MFQRDFETEGPGLDQRRHLGDVASWDGNSTISLAFEQVWDEVRHGEGDFIDGHPGLSAPKARGRHMGVGPLVETMVPGRICK